MVPPYELQDLEEWDARIRDKVRELGLDCYPQEFEVCDHNQMLGYMAYSGMPSHYPHWSYGKAYEKLKTLYDYGVSGLPYEMVINSNPALAYLMRDNSLLLQILTIAHVYGHNDFFKNNFTFKSTRAEYTIGTFKAHGKRVRPYVEDPSIGLEKVEAVLDAAHAVSLQCRRNLAMRKRTPDEERQRCSMPPSRRATRSSAFIAGARPWSPICARSRSRPTKTCCCSSATTIRSSPSGRRTCSPSCTRRRSTSFRRSKPRS